MQIVRTSDVVRFAKAQIEHFQKIEKKSLDALEEAKLEWQKTIWYRWFGMKFSDNYGLWDHYFTGDQIRKYKALLAKAEYNEKLQYEFIEYDNEVFFNWAKANNVPF